MDPHPFRCGRVAVGSGISLCLLAACASAPREADPAPASAQSPLGLSINAIESFYTINGSTARELHNAILTTGPRIQDWPLFASTEWQIEWKLRTATGASRGRRVPRGCRLEASVTLTTTMLMPRWVPGPEVSDSLVRQWNFFLASLTRHERGHRDLGVEAAREVLRTLRAVPENQCATLSRDADAAARQVVDRHRARNVEYDQETRFGQTQGVIWPPEPQTRP